MIERNSIGKTSLVLPKVGRPNKGSVWAISVSLYPCEDIKKNIVRSTYIK
jgi:hypothetical protein